jgi:hypothetical protein
VCEDTRTAQVRSSPLSRRTRAVQRSDGRRRGDFAYSAAPKTGFQQLQSNVTRAKPASASRERGPTPRPQCSAYDSLSGHDRDLEVTLTLGNLVRKVGRFFSGKCLIIVAEILMLTLAARSSAASRSIENSRFCLEEHENVERVAA